MVPGDPNIRWMTSLHRTKAGITEGNPEDEQAVPLADFPCAELRRLPAEGEERGCRAVTRLSLSCVRRVLVLPGRADDLAEPGNHACVTAPGSEQGKV